MQCVILSHSLIFFLENLNCQKDKAIAVYISKQELSNTFFWNLPTEILGITQPMPYKYIVKPNDIGILLQNGFKCYLRLRIL